MILGIDLKTLSKARGISCVAMLVAAVVTVDVTQFHLIGPELLLLAFGLPFEPTVILAFIGYFLTRSKANLNRNVKKAVLALVSALAIIGVLSGYRVESDQPLFNILLFAVPVIATFIGFSQPHRAQSKPIAAKSRSFPWASAAVVAVVTAITIIASCMTSEMMLFGFFILPGFVFSIVGYFSMMPKLRLGMAQKTLIWVPVSLPALLFFYMVLNGAGDADILIFILEITALMPIFATLIGAVRFMAYGKNAAARPLCS